MVQATDPQKTLRFNRRFAWRSEFVDGEGLIIILRAASLKGKFFCALPARNFFASSRLTNLRFANLSAVIPASNAKAACP